LAYSRPTTRVATAIACWSYTQFNQLGCKEGGYFFVRSFQGSSFIWIPMLPVLRGHTGSSSCPSEKNSSEIPKRRIGARWNLTSARKVWTFSNLVALGARVPAPRAPFLVCPIIR
jgi:hypothetical protein